MEKLIWDIEIPTLPSAALPAETPLRHKCPACGDALQTTEDGLEVCLSAWCPELGEELVT